MSSKKTKFRSTEKNKKTSDLSRKNSRAMQLLHMNEAIRARERMASIGSPQAARGSNHAISPIQVPSASTTTLKAEDE